MSVQAKMYVDDCEYNILKLDFGYSQATNPNGYPCCKPLGGIFNITYETTKDPHLFRWAVHNNAWKHNMQLKKVTLVFYPIPYNSKSRTIELYDTLCVKHHTYFDAVNNQPIKTDIQLSPAIIVQNGVPVVEKHWKVTDLSVLKSNPGTANQSPVEKTEEPRELTVKKVEGPFNDQNKLVDELIPGVTYSYKATQYSRKPTEEELAGIHWSQQTDEGAIESAQTIEKYIDARKACMKISFRQGEKVKIYAYSDALVNEVNVETALVKIPFCVDRYKIPGLNKQGDDIAEDLTYGYGKHINKGSVYTKEEIEFFKTNYINNSQNFGLPVLSNRQELSGHDNPHFELTNKMEPTSDNSYRTKAIYSKEKIYNIDYNIDPVTYTFLEVINTIRTASHWLGLNVPEDITSGALVKYLDENCPDDNQLFNGFEETACRWFATGELEGNLRRMIAKFKRNEGGVYEDEVLTQHIENHPETLDYCQNLEDFMAEKIKGSNGKLSSLINNKPDFTYDDRKNGQKGKHLKDGFQAFMRPMYSAFNKKWNVLSGETIATNDIWATEVHLKDFKLKGEDYTISYEVTLWDHFGLDKSDLEKYFNIIGQARLTFSLWFTLQHLRGYKPFITKITFQKQFSGNLNEGREELKKRRETNDVLNNPDRFKAL
ncbi:DUF3289 family protein [Marinilabiliaceae bacterium JC017]|nr:DUF3289 family protein [Marinilabiliaceae bacterium JC017]